MYNIYHIPGKKIGVTRNLNKRVTEQQGYAPEEYEVLFKSDDINIISNLEIELQKSYGYKVDRQSYKNLINKNNTMNINATEQTSTFPCPLSKLKGQLMDNLDLTWETSHGKFTITSENIPWIIANAKTSMFNNNRCYVYNKALLESIEVKADMQSTLPTWNQNERFELIRQWAQERGIYDSGDSKTQYIKLMEEAGELAKALLEKNAYEVKDAIGDIVVVLTNLAALEGMTIENCIDSAYDEIKSRKGKMTNGTFVKEKSAEQLIKDYVKSTL
jgi:NTP pyrophosphatase (non-canonical NTP hydrolase)|tara:strand:- start:964 stop:1785 length:822 start_codon:yes stop_codon:yes gene_type:complete